MKSNNAFGEKICLKERLEAQNSSEKLIKNKFVGCELD
jgi:hypothetical protein